MSRPIPVEVIPAHAYLSHEDQVTLFGEGHPMTVAEERSQVGQVVYEETVEVFGKLKRSLKVRVLGPNWEKSHVELSPTEAVYLGLSLEETKSGDTSQAAPCKLVGPSGEVSLYAGAIIPRSHLLASVDEAKALHLSNGAVVSVDILGERTQVLDNVIVRVHPTFRLRLEIHSGVARELWITRPAHARLRS